MSWTSFISARTATNLISAPTSGNDQIDRAVHIVAADTL